MSLSALLVKNLIPQTLRVLAEALNHIATIFENLPIEDDRSTATVTRASINTPTTSSATINYGPCLYCARSRLDHDIPTCFYHLDRKTKRELYKDL